MEVRWKDKERERENEKTKTWRETKLQSLRV